MNEIQTLNTSTPQDWYILITVFTIYNYPWAYNLQKKSIHLFIWFILYIHTLSIHFITKQNLLFDAYTNNTYKYIRNFVAIMSTFQTQARLAGAMVSLEVTPWIVNILSYTSLGRLENSPKYYIQKNGKKYENTKIREREREREFKRAHLLK